MLQSTSVATTQISSKSPIMVQKWTELSSTTTSLRNSGTTQTQNRISSYKAQQQQNWTGFNSFQQKQNRMRTQAVKRKTSENESKPDLKRHREVVFCLFFVLVLSRKLRNLNSRSRLNLLVFEKAKTRFELYAKMDL